MCGETFCLVFSASLCLGSEFLGAVRSSDQVLRLAAEKWPEVFECRIENPPDGFAAVKGDVRGDDDVIAVQERVVQEQRAQLVLGEGLSRSLGKELKDNAGEEANDDRQRQERGRCGEGELPPQFADH